MGNQSTKDYRFPEKHKWRQWSWRQIKKRLWERGIRTKDAKGLYLAAESDKDRDVACRKNGFRPENLIAVEKDPATVKKLRAKRVIVLNEDIWDVLWAFDPGYIQFVNLDFCNGFTNSCWNLMDQSIGTFNSIVPPYHPVCVNLLAGRDRTAILDHFKKEYGHAYDGPPNRCVMFLIAMIASMSDFQEKFFNRRLSEEEIDEIKIRMNPSFYDYKSGNVNMHSVVFNMPCTVGHFLGSLSREELHDFFPGKFVDNKQSNLNPKILKAFKKEKQIRNQIISAKAIRTQRINGTLSPSPSK